MNVNFVYSKTREVSRSPPAQRHLHTHHHTHVLNPGYPTILGYDPYGGKTRNTTLAPVILGFTHTCDLLGTNYCVNFSVHTIAKNEYTTHRLNLSVHSKVDQIADVNALT